MRPAGIETAAFELEDQKRVYQILPQPFKMIHRPLIINSFSFFGMSIGVESCQDVAISHRQNFRQGITKVVLTPFLPWPHNSASQYTSQEKKHF